MTKVWSVGGELVVDGVEPEDVLVVPGDDDDCPAQWTKNGFAVYSMFTVKYSVDGLFTIRGYVNSVCFQNTIVNMHPSAAFSLLTDLRLAVISALPKILLAVLRSPSLAFRPSALSDIFMAKVWLAFGDSVDESARPVKEVLILEYAQGLVLDLGAGHGHSVNYLDPHKVSKYVALEPNTVMHPHIRSAANKAGFSEPSGTLQILSCGAEDVLSILGATGGEQQVDTLLSILTLCTVPAPRHTLDALLRHVLRPTGGQFLFYEHVLSDRPDVAWWQRFWTPLWSAVFGGCRLDRPTHHWIEGMEDGFWKEGEVSRLRGEAAEHLFCHRLGRLVRA